MSRKLTYKEKVNSGVISSGTVPPSAILSAARDVLMSEGLSSDEGEGSMRVSALQHNVNFLTLVEKSAREVRNQVSLQHARVMKKASKRAGGTRIQRGPFVDVIPDRIRVTLKCVQLTARASAAGPMYLTIQVNDCKDPMGTFGAVQPIGFDQWMTFYSFFIVIKSKTTIRMQASTATNLDVALSIGNAAFVTGGFARVAAQARAVWGQYIGAFQSPVLQTPWYDHPEIAGLSLEDYRANTNYQGTSSTSPLYAVEGTFYAQNSAADNDATAFALNHAIHLEQEVEFFTRLDQVDA